MTTDLEELQGRHQAPDVSSAASLPAVPMGQVAQVGSWGMEISEPILLPMEFEVNDWLITITTALDDPNDHLTVSGVQLGDGSSNEIWPGVDAYQVTAVTDSVVLIEPTGRCNHYFAAYRGLAGHETVQRYGASGQWQNERIQVHQPEILYNTATALVGTASHVVCVTYGDAPLEAMDFTYYPSDLGYGGSSVTDASGNPAIDINHAIKWEYFDNGNRNGRQPNVDVESYPDGVPAYPWSIHFYTFILATLQVAMLTDDPGNSAPAGSSHLPIFTRPD